MFVSIRIIMSPRLRQKGLPLVSSEGSGPMGPTFGRLSLVTVSMVILGALTRSWSTVTGVLLFGQFSPRRSTRGVLVVLKRRQMLFLRFVCLISARVPMIVTRRNLTQGKR